MPKTTITLDGTAFQTLEGFFAHFQQRALDGASWGRNLNAFNDVLRGGFGTPDDGFILLWRDHAASQRALGYEETVRQLTGHLETCHPENRAQVQEDILRAQRDVGQTVYDWLIEIIRTHGPDGTESEDGVELVLA